MFRFNLSNNRCCQPKVRHSSIINDSNLQPKLDQSAKMSIDVAEKAENGLREYYRKRDHLQKELHALHLEMKQALDKIFRELGEELEQQSQETNASLDPIVEEFKTLIARRKELDSMKQKLMPVFELMGGVMPTS